MFMAAVVIPKRRRRSTLSLLDQTKTGTESDTCRSKESKLGKC